MTTLTRLFRATAPAEETGRLAAVASLRSPQS